jgi:cytochrome c peroxidase
MTCKAVSAKLRAPERLLARIRLLNWSAAAFLSPVYAALGLGGLVLFLQTLPASAQVNLTLPLIPLKLVPTPEPANLNQYLQTNAKGAITPAARAAAIALGKALFWDQAVGSDGQACASCHFNAGADSRMRNQVDPGIRAIPSQTVWGAKPPQQTGGVGAPFTPDYQLAHHDFPLLKFNIAGDRTSGIASDTQAVVSSAGVFNSVFGDIAPLQPCPAVDQNHLTVNICDKFAFDILPPGPGTNGLGSIFNRDSPASLTGQVRNVEPRNTPTVINAVFNFRNFWDSRARNEFNGVDPIGDLDPYARVLINNKGLQKVALNNATLVNGVLVPNPFGPLRLEDSSLASQAVGPALSDMEMSAQQRSFAKLGKKMLALSHALPAQIVAPDDSVLGSNTAAGVTSNYPSKGINKNYVDLIKAAFQPRWYSGSQIVSFAGGNDADGTVKLTFSNPPKSSALTTDQFTQMEFNFSLFWGLAVQMYEATLRADDSPFDQALDSGNPLTFNSAQWGDQQKQGWLAFQGAGRCINCHGNSELTNASVRNVRLIDGKIETMVVGDLNTASYDVGSYNIAVRRCLDQSVKVGGVTDPSKFANNLCDDGGVGTTIGPLNLPLSFVRFSEMVALHNINDPNDPITIVCTNQPTACTNVLGVVGRVAVDGAFKAPGLRNVELTAPYMHNGGELSLMDVVDFYDRGGNFPDYNIQNLDADIGNILCQQRDSTGACTSFQFQELGLSNGEKDALVAFLKALTDERVRAQRAPFDHPQIFIPNLPADRNCPQCLPGELPAVGANGTTVHGVVQQPLPTFADGLLFP